MNVFQSRRASSVLRNDSNCPVNCLKCGHLKSHFMNPSVINKLVEKSGLHGGVFYAAYSINPCERFKDSYRVAANKNGIVVPRIFTFLLNEEQFKYVCIQRTTRAEMYGISNLPAWMTKMDVNDQGRWLHEWFVYCKARREEEERQQNARNRHENDGSGSSSSPSSQDSSHFHNNDQGGGSLNVGVIDQVNRSGHNSVANAAENDSGDTSGRAFVAVKMESDDESGKVSGSRNNSKRGPSGEATFNNSAKKFKSDS